MQHDLKLILPISYKSTGIIYILSVDIRSYLVIFVII